MAEKDKGIERNLHKDPRWDDERVEYEDKLGENYKANGCEMERRWLQCMSVKGEKIEVKVMKYLCAMFNEEGLVMRGWGWEQNWSDMQNHFDTKKRSFWLQEVKQEH